MNDLDRMHAFSALAHSRTIPTLMRGVATCETYAEAESMAAAWSAYVGSEVRYGGVANGIGAFCVGSDSFTFRATCSSCAEDTKAPNVRECAACSGADGWKAVAA